MSTEHLEIEQKYDVDPNAGWLDLGSLPGVRSVATPTVADLEATYYDTDDLALAARGITLRRRTGGSDAGWHLKLPAGAGKRLERGEPLGDADAGVPTPLAELVRGWVRDHRLRPVATLSTSRTAYRLLGDNDAVLAEAADDVVTAQAHADDGTAIVSTWREWEFELVDGPAELIQTAGARMRDAGATDSPWPSKLARALGGRLADRPVPLRFTELNARGRAGDVVLAHLIEQVTAMQSRDRQARHDEPDGVHKMRVATRRLRSALATFRPLFDRAVTDPLRDELKWIAGELGRARDAEVLRMRLLDELAQEPDDLVLGPVAARIEAELRADHRKAHDALLEALNSERYYRLLDHLDVLVLTPPYTPLADGKAATVLSRRVRRSYLRVATLVANPPKETGRTADRSRDAWYHEIRKAAKRLRYAAESVERAFGQPAADFAAAAEQLQEVLGEHQDSVVARQALRDLGARIHLDGDNAFTIGRLHAFEQARGDDAVAAFAPAWAALSRKKLRRWLRT